jgi:hypothetical protein
MRKPLLEYAELGDLESIKHLIEEENVAVDEPGLYDTTALMCASTNGQLEVVQYLVEAGAESSHVNWHGSTPLHWACRGGHEDVVHFFLALNVDVDIPDQFGWRPLHIACSLEDGRGMNCAALLLGRNSSLAAPTRLGDTPLHVCATVEGTGSVRTSMLLVQHGAEVNASNLAGKTPLHIAAERGFVEMVEYLLSVGASTSQVDESGRNALVLALKGECCPFPLVDTDQKVQQNINVTELPEMPLFGNAVVVDDERSLRYKRLILSLWRQMPAPTLTELPEFWAITLVGIPPAWQDILKDILSVENGASSDEVSARASGELGDASQTPSAEQDTIFDAVTGALSSGWMGNSLALGESVEVARERASRLIAAMQTSDSSEGLCRAWSSHIETGQGEFIVETASAASDRGKENSQGLSEGTAHIAEGMELEQTEETAGAEAGEERQLHFWLSAPGKEPASSSLAHILANVAGVDGLLLMHPGGSGTASLAAALWGGDTSQARSLMAELASLSLLPPWRTASRTQLFATLHQLRLPPWIAHLRAVSPHSHARLSSCHVLWQGEWKLHFSSELSLATTLQQSPMEWSILADPSGRQVHPGEMALLAHAQSCYEAAAALLRAALAADDSWEESPLMEEDNGLKDAGSQESGSHPQKEREKEKEKEGDEAQEQAKPAEEKEKEQVGLDEKRSEVSQSSVLSHASPTLVAVTQAQQRVEALRAALAAAEVELAAVKSQHTAALEALEQRSFYEQLQQWMEISGTFREEAKKQECARALKFREESKDVLFLTLRCILWIKLSGLRLATQRTLAVLDQIRQMLRTVHSMLEAGVEEPVASLRSSIAVLSRTAGKEGQIMDRYLGDVSLTLSIVRGWEHLLQLKNIAEEDESAFSAAITAANNVAHDLSTSLNPPNLSSASDSALASVSA